MGLGGDILIALAHAVAANEKTQRKFRYGVISKLCRIEALLGLVQVSQLARDQHGVGYYEEKLREDSQAAEAYVARTGYEAGLAMVKYITERRRRRTRASGEGEGGLGGRFEARQADHWRVREVRVRCRR